MTIRQAYDTWSATYDEDVNRTRDLDREALRKLLSGWRCRAILELGCGTGKHTGFLSHIAPSVQALDFSEGMLAKARSKLPAQNVSFKQADLTAAWPCAERSVDLVVGTLVLEHIRDLDWIFTEAGRVLEDGGRLLLSELHPARQYQGIQARFRNAAGMTLIPAYVHHLSDFTGGAAVRGLVLLDFREWWHVEDPPQGSPRLVTMIFSRPG